LATKSTTSAHTPDFGKTGKLTIRTNVTGATINTSAGEFVHCELRVVGAQALFSFACTHRPLRSAKDFPPGDPFVWDHLKHAGDLDAPIDAYSLVLSFLQAIKYTFVMEHRKAAGTVLKTLKDVDYESTSPDDVFRDSLIIFTV
jgi:hypothetical protein